MLRRPTAADRQIAEFVRNLPLGVHQITVQPDHFAPLKSEGAMILRHGSNLIIVEVHRARQPVSTKRLTNGNT